MPTFIIPVLSAPGVVLFLTVLSIMTIYYAVKFVLSLITGG